MAIRTVKNGKGKVIGLEVAGKRYILDRNLCSALSTEELKAQQKANDTFSRLKGINNELSQKFYYSNSKLSIKIQFDGKQRLNQDTAIIDFGDQLKNESQSTKDLILKVLNQFISSINDAKAQHSKDIEDKIKEIITDPNASNKAA